MNFFLPTIILRHRRENLKKCSLRGLEPRKDLSFFTYPKDLLPDLTNYVLLSFDGPQLSITDREKGLLLIDGTWRYAMAMLKNTPGLKDLPRRSLPPEIQTAYPRKQEDCENPERGLASVEALYLAYLLQRHDPKGLLDHYFWKEDFLRKNFPGANLDNIECNPLCFSN